MALSWKAAPPSVPPRVRLVFLGAAGVGKTALIRRFLHGAFEPSHRRTVEELHVLELELAGGAPPGHAGGRRRRGPPTFLRLEVLDTSGSYSFPAMRRLSLRHGDAFALVFSPHEPGSWEEAARLRREILEAKRGGGGGGGGDPEAAVVVVAANKSDLAAGAGADAPSAEAAEEAATRWGARYLEVSAKEGRNVARLFRELLAHVSPPGGSLSPALRRRSSPELWPKDERGGPVPPRRAGRGRNHLMRPSCALS